MRFRTSPPLEAVKPGKRTVAMKGSPPAKLVHYEVSPRKRSRHVRHSHLQRPYLDFEKMQQVNEKAVIPRKKSGAANNAASQKKKDKKESSPDLKNPGHFSAKSYRDFECSKNI